MSLNRGRDRAVLIGDGRPPPVEHHCGVDPITLLSGHLEREAATNAEADDTERLRRDVRIGQQVVNGAREITRGLIYRQFLEHLRGRVCLMRYPSAEVIRREGDETLSGEAIHEVSNVVIKTPPLFDHDQARSGSAIWLVQIAMGLPAVARKSHVLSRVGLGHRTPFIAVEDAIHLPFPVLSATIFLRQPESVYAPPGLSAMQFHNRVLATTQSTHGW